LEYVDFNESRFKLEGSRQYRSFHLMNSFHFRVDSKTSYLDYQSWRSIRDAIPNIRYSPDFDHQAAAFCVMHKSPNLVKYVASIFSTDAGENSGTSWDYGEFVPLESAWPGWSDSEYLAWRFDDEGNYVRDPPQTIYETKYYRWSIDAIGPKEIKLSFKRHDGSYYVCKCAVPNSFNIKARGYGRSFLMEPSWGETMDTVFPNFMVMTCHYFNSSFHRHIPPDKISSDMAQLFYFLGWGYDPPYKGPGCDVCVPPMVDGLWTVDEANGKERSALCRAGKIEGFAKSRFVTIGGYSPACQQTWKQAVGFLAIL